MDTAKNLTAPAPAILQPGGGPLHLVTEIGLMTARSLRNLARSPEAVLPSVFTSVFFLLIFHAAIGGASAFLPEFEGVRYIAFTLPLSLISAALDSSAGQAIVRDIESGYFDKLLLTPVSRAALLLGHIIAGGVIIMLICLLLIATALVMGLQPATGIGGLLVLLGFALLIGMGFGGLAVGVALRTGSAAATQGAAFAFFPFAFLTTAFFPIEYLGGWLAVAARLNPVTYILEALRTLLITGWDARSLLVGLAAAALLSLVPFLFAVTGLQARVRRG